MRPLNSISVLCFGDCCGRVGRRALNKLIPLLKDKYQADFVIVNSENATHGRGCSLESYNELVEAGADCLTSGNHFYDQRDVMNEKASILFERQIRPLNFAPQAPLRGSLVFPVKGYTLRVTNLIGRVEIQGAQSNPFLDMDKLLKETKPTDFHIVDFHAEATGEKRALAEYLDGRISLFMGTHTHVQTNDAQMLDKGTLFISDLGMCGLYDSCLGMLKESVINRTAFGLPGALQIAEEGLGFVSGIHVLLAKDKKESKIETFSVKVNT